MGLTEFLFEGGERLAVDATKEEIIATSERAVADKVNIEASRTARRAAMTVGERHSAERLDERITASLEGRRRLLPEDRGTVQTRKDELTAKIRQAKPPPDGLGQSLEDAGLGAAPEGMTEEEYLSTLEAEAADMERALEGCNIECLESRMSMTRRIAEATEGDIGKAAAQDAEEEAAERVAESEGNKAWNFLKKNALGKLPTLLALGILGLIVGRAADDETINLQSCECLCMHKKYDLDTPTCTGFRSGDTPDPCTADDLNDVIAPLLPTECKNGCKFIKKGDTICLDNTEEYSSKCIDNDNNIGTCGSSSCTNYLKITKLGGGTIFLTFLVIFAGMLVPFVVKVLLLGGGFDGRIKFIFIMMLISFIISTCLSYSEWYVNILRSRVLASRAKSDGSGSQNDPWLAKILDIPAPGKSFQEIPMISTDVKNDDNPFSCSDGIKDDWDDPTLSAPDKAFYSSLYNDASGSPDLAKAALKPADTSNCDLYYPIPAGSDRTNSPCPTIFPPRSQIFSGSNDGLFITGWQDPSCNYKTTPGFNIESLPDATRQTVDSTDPDPDAICRNNNLSTGDIIPSSVMFWKDDSPQGTPHEYCLSLSGGVPTKIKDKDGKDMDLCSVNYKPNFAENKLDCSTKTEKDECNDMNECVWWRDPQTLLPINHDYSENGSKGSMGVYGEIDPDARAGGTPQVIPPPPSDNYTLWIFKPPWYKDYYFYIMAGIIIIGGSLAMYTIAIKKDVMGGAGTGLLTLAIAGIMFYVQYYIISTEKKIKDVVNETDNYLKTKINNIESGATAMVATDPKYPSRCTSIYDSQFNKTDDQKQIDCCRRKCNAIRDKYKDTPENNPYTPSNINNNCIHSNMKILITICVLVIFIIGCIILLETVLKGSNFFGAIFRAKGNRKRINKNKSIVEDIPEPMKAVFTALLGDKKNNTDNKKTDKYSRWAMGAFVVMIVAAYIYIHFFFEAKEGFSVTNDINLNISEFGLMEGLYRYFILGYVYDKIGDDEVCVTQECSFNPETGEQNYPPFGQINNDMLLGVMYRNISSGISCNPISNIINPELCTSKIRDPTTNELLDIAENIQDDERTAECAIYANDPHLLAQCVTCNNTKVSDIYQPSDIPSADTGFDLEPGDQACSYVNFNIDDSEAMKNMISCDKIHLNMPVNRLVCERNKCTVNDEETMCLPCMKETSIKSCDDGGTLINQCIDPADPQTKTCIYMRQLYTDDYQPDLTDRTTQNWFGYSGQCTDPRQPPASWSSGDPNPFADNSNYPDVKKLKDGKYIDILTEDECTRQQVGSPADNQYGRFDYSGFGLYTGTKEMCEYQDSLTGGFDSRTTSESTGCKFTSLCLANDEGDPVPPSDCIKIAGKCFDGKSVLIMSLLGPIIGYQGVKYSGKYILKIIQGSVGGIKSGTVLTFDILKGLVNLTLKTGGTGVNALRGFAKSINNLREAGLAATAMNKSELILKTTKVLATSVKDLMFKQITKIREIGSAVGTKIAIMKAEDYSIKETVKGAMRMGAARIGDALTERLATASVADLLGPVGWAFNAVMMIGMAIDIEDPQSYRAYISQTRDVLPMRNQIDANYLNTLFYDVSERLDGKRVASVQDQKPSIWQLSHLTCIIDSKLDESTPFKLILIAFREALISLHVRMWEDISESEDDTMKNLYDELMNSIINKDDFSTPCSGEIMTKYYINEIQELYENDFVSRDKHIHNYIKEYLKNGAPDLTETLSPDWKVDPTDNKWAEKLMPRSQRIINQGYLHEIAKLKLEVDNPAVDDNTKHFYNTILQKLRKKQIDTNNKWTTGDLIQTYNTKVKQFASSVSLSLAGKILFNKIMDWEGKFYHWTGWKNDSWSQQGANESDGDHAHKESESVRNITPTDPRQLSLKLDPTNAPKISYTHIYRVATKFEGKEINTGLPQMEPPETLLGNNKIAYSPIVISKDNEISDKNGFPERLPLYYPSNSIIEALCRGGVRTLKLLSGNNSGISAMDMMGRGDGEGDNVGQDDWYPYLFHSDYDENTGTCNYNNPNYTPKYEVNYCARFGKAFTNDDGNSGFSHVREATEEGPVSPDSEWDDLTRPRTNDQLIIAARNSDNPLFGKFIQSCEDEASAAETVGSMLLGDTFTNDIARWNYNYNTNVDTYGV